MSGNITIGKIASVSVVVDNKNTAKTVGSGNLDVFATPMMIALMEKAACECLSDVLEAGQTSVGTHIDVSHIAASPIGAEIIATAAIEAASGRTIEFSVTASDGNKEIGSGKHTRVVIDAERFMGKLKKDK
jgi:predicted thioesterase